VDEPKFQIEDLIIEGILAGVFRTCEAVQLTPFGQWVLEPFKDVFTDDLAVTVVDKVFRAAGRQEMSDTDFLRGFVDLALKHGEDGLGLLEILNGKTVRAHVADALGAASVQFGVFLVLCGVYLKSLADEAHRVAVKDGTVALVG